MAALAAEKLEAIRCWTNDPCGAVEGTPGTAKYAEELVAARLAYAPWMAQILGYEGARGRDVLDVGCGQGIDLIRFARGGARVTGIDLTPRHVELARQHLEALGLEGVVFEGDAERLPFPDDSFDIVSSNGVLHHTPDMEAALREIRRVLRPGGEARLIVYHRDSLHYWGEQRLVQGLLRRRGVLTNVERSSVEARPLVRVYSRAQLRGVLEDAGFTGVELSVRQFDPSDFVATHALRRFISPAIGDRIGRAAGWYLCAVAS